MEISPLRTKIDKTIQIKLGTIVLEEHSGFPMTESNLYLIGSNGKIVWTAEKPEARTLFTRLRLNEDFTISTFTTSGQFCDINIETGKIISSSAFK
ncbi:MAG: hypothetical protein IT311_06605 [Anaerolineales bacterium]|nr:hypothetical protein [Anaerolineales bacterium]